MPRDTSKPRRLRARLSIAALALLVAAAAGLGTGTAAAAKHHHHGGAHDSGDGQWQPGHGGPGDGQQQPPNDYPVPGIDYSTAPQDLEPPPISVLKTSPEPRPGTSSSRRRALPPRPRCPASRARRSSTTRAGRSGSSRSTALHGDRLPRPAVPRPAGPHLHVGQSTGGPGHSEGEDVILDQHYQQIATVSRRQRARGRSARVPPHPAGDGADHDLPPGPLRPLLGRRPGQRLRSSTGSSRRSTSPPARSLFEWDSLDHVPLSDSYSPVPTDPATP